MAVFFGFEDEDDVFEQFDASGDDQSTSEILVAAYDTPPYEGYAFVLFRDKINGKFYEVNGSHCSCMGLEDQWDPEEIVVEEIIKRPSYVGWESEGQEEIRAAVREALGV